MRKSILLLIFSILITAFASAQLGKGEIVLNSTDNTDNAVIQTKDNGYLVAGNITYSGPGGTNIWLVKLDTNGKPLWSEYMGDSSLDNESALIKTTDGGYAITGYSNSTNDAGGEDMLIVKLNDSGSVQWVRTIGGVNNDWGGQLYQTADKGYMLFGSTQSFRSGAFTDLYLVKLDSAGNLKWTKTIKDSSDSVVFQCVTQSMAGGYMIVASEKYTAGTTLSFTKIDDNGNVLWRRAMAGQYIGSSGAPITATSIIQIKNGNYVTVGYQGGVGLVVLTDSLCTKDSVRKVPLGGVPGNVRVNSATATNDGGFAFTGSSPGYVGDSLFVMKADSNGILQWYYDLPGIPSTYNVSYSGNAIIQTKDNGYAVAGDDDMAWSPGLQWYWGYFTKLDNKGNGCRYSSVPKSWKGTATYTSSFPSLSDSMGSGGVLDADKFKILGAATTDSIVCRVLGFENITEPIGSVKIYPNPVVDNLTIDISGINADKVELTITNEVGQVLLNKQVNLNANTININTSSYRSGIYFVSFKTDKGMLTKKFVKM